MTKSQIQWQHLTSTLWFVPTILVLGGILLAFLFVEFDVFIGDQFGIFSGIFRVQPSGARDMLAVIASTAITVAGTVFSITIVALTLASTQFSPRILRNFMSDSGNQAVLGALLGIFAYCIIVLRTIRDGGDNPAGNFVPSTSVIFGIFLGFVGIGCLIYYIHHVSVSIQATTIISVIAEETIEEICATFPVEDDSPPIHSDTEKHLANSRSLEVFCVRVGYIQNADTEELVRLAEKYDLVLKMQRRIGQFVIKDLPILRIFPKTENFVLDQTLAQKFRNAYDIGDYRTVEGDVAFGLRQIVDIALKALSPAVNDPTTAVICIDYLTSILSTLAKRPSCPSNVFEDGKLRLIVEQQRYKDFFDLAFNQIRQNAGGNVAIILRQLNSINILSKINLKLDCRDERRERLDLMKTQTRLLFEMARRTIEVNEDLQTIERYHRQIEKSLAEREGEV